MDGPQSDDRQRPERPQLGADRIADEAMKLIDEKGLGGFSYRGLAARMGCQAMSLYHYYPSKAHLFEALVEICIRETPVPAPGPDWRSGLRELARNYRGTALRHPGFFLHFIIFRMNNHAGMTHLEQILRLFAATGLDTAAQARHFRCFAYYVMGAGLDEAMGYVHGPTATTPASADEARRDFPAITEAGAYFGAAYHETTFETGLSIMLDGIAAAIDAQPPADPLRNR
jgi:AcrR family transcriptional regulator